MKVTTWMTFFSKALLTLAALFLLSVKSQAIQTEDSSYYFAGSNAYYCSSTATVVGTGIAAGVTVSNPPLILVNPIGSNVKAVVFDTSVNFTASPAASAQLYLQFNVVPSTPVGAPWSTGTVTSASIGLSTGTFTKSLMGCYTGGILPSTPIPFRYIGGTTGASAIGGVSLVDHSYPPGSVVVPPGGILSVGSTSVGNVVGHIAWIEVPQ